jgi:hypothetical protein
MRRGRYPELVNPYEETIKRLEYELYEARRAIISLMPEEVQKILGSYSSCESHADTYSWGGHVAE